MRAALFTVPTGSDSKFCPMKEGPSGEKERKLNARLIKSDSLEFAMENGGYYATFADNEV